MNWDKKHSVSRTLAKLRKRLSTTCEAAYLYGSQLDRPRANSDIDVLLIVSGPDQRKSTSHVIAELQREVSRVIHPTYIERQEAIDNPMFAEIMRKGVHLWRLDAR